MTSIIETLRTRESALTASELSELLNIPRSSIYAMAKRSSVPHYLFGTTIRFDPADIAAWLQYRRVGKTKKGSLIAAL